jgi:hypothetical protein
VPKISLTLALGLIAGSAFVTTAEAKGGGGANFFYLLYVKPYKDSQASQSKQSDPSAEQRDKARRAIARARAEQRAREQAEAAAQARLLGAAAKTDIVKVGTTSPKTDDATTTALKKSDLETSPPSTVDKASGAPTCHKYSPAVGGMVDAACE